MKVKATEMYKKLNVKDNELQRVLEEGEEFEVSKERFDVLNGNNAYNAIFVEEVSEAVKVDEVVIDEENIISEEEAKNLKEDEVIDVEAKKVTVKKSTRKKK